MQPEMSAYEVKDELVKAIKSNEYDLIIINFANPDMVGHTGILDAAIKAVEAVDYGVGKVVEAVKKKGGVVAPAATSDEPAAEEAKESESKPN